LSHPKARVLDLARFSLDGEEKSNALGMQHLARSSLTHRTEEWHLQKTLIRKYGKKEE